MISKYKIKPDSEDGGDNRKYLEELLAKKWQTDMLELNPDYLGWGVYEDYMMGDSRYPHSWQNPLFYNSWKEFSYPLNDLNECVNYYFSVRRESEECKTCGGNGSNSETKKLYDTFYGTFNGFTKTSDGWQNNLTQDEVDVLWEKKRFFHLHGLNEKPTIEEANQYSHHDGINHWTLTEVRAKRLGVWGLCSTCEGKGYVFIENVCHLQLTLWVLLPRKGCSRGLEIKHLDKEDISPALEWLNEAARRNAQRFSPVTKNNAYT